MSRAHDDEACGAESLYWTLATNEEGWACAHCAGHAGGDPPGYRPDLDREFISVKVHAILLELHESEFIYVSNSDHGGMIAAAVASRCEALGQFDQYTIIRLVLEELDSHGQYWKRISEGVLTGDDPRARCHCGQLATSFHGQGKHYCRAHAPRLLDDRSLAADWTPEEQEHWQC